VFCLLLYYYITYVFVVSRYCSGDCFFFVHHRYLHIQVVCRSFWKVFLFVPLFVVCQYGSYVIIEFVNFYVVISPNTANTVTTTESSELLFLNNTFLIILWSEIFVVQDGVYLSPEQPESIQRVSPPAPTVVCERPPRSSNIFIVICHNYISLTVLP